MNKVKKNCYKCFPQQNLVFEEISLQYEIDIFYRKIFHIKIFVQIKNCYIQLNSRNFKKDVCPGAPGQNFGLFMR